MWINGSLNKPVGEVSWLCVTTWT